MFRKIFRRVTLILRRRLELTQKRAVLDSLEFCGDHVEIRLPIVIECADRVTIHDNVSIASFVHMWGNAGIEIGPRTMIASHVAITTATHDANTERMNESLIAKPIRIEADVWIGAHSIIFPGVTLGRHSVIAAGSVVRNDVEPYTVVAGVPAKIIRRLNIEGREVNA